MPFHKKLIKKTKRFVSKLSKKVNPFRKVREAIGGKKKTQARRPRPTVSRKPRKVRSTPPHNQATPRQVRPRVRRRQTPTQRRSSRVLRRRS